MRPIKHFRLALLSLAVLALSLAPLQAANPLAELETLLSTPPRLLEQSPNEPSIARVTAQLLERAHFKQQPLNDDVSSQFLDRYLKSLDNLHMHFLQSDLEEFEQYRTTLDDLTLRGDTRPGRIIFSRFVQRLQQRVAYVKHLLDTEEFNFDTDEYYLVDRKTAPYPADIDEAKQLWRKHLKHELLQERLNEEAPEKVNEKILRRYARLLSMIMDYDSDEVFELYLRSLTHVYDPHSDYMGRATLENFAIGMKLSLFGIGAMLQSEDGYCKIISLVPGGPAAKSGKLSENDKIIAVAQGDGEAVDVVDMKLRKIVDMIRGPKGSEVRLTVNPADAPDLSVRKVVKIIRDEIKMEEQEAKAKIFDLQQEDGSTRRIGLIDLPSFYADFNLMNEEQKGESKSTTTDVAKLIRKLKQEKIEGLILDLRRNGGGSLEEAINLTGLFIDQGPVVQVKGPAGPTLIDEDTDPGSLYDGPMLVLTSRFSASASEILAGALQDYDRALIVGDKSTHGKGTVQSLIQLDNYLQRWLKPGENPGALKVTIRKFYRASGASTQKEGIVPDIVLPSLNNLAEVGEASFDNPLEWDSTEPAEYQDLNQIQPLLDELRQRSEARLEKDPDFAYLREDLKHMEELMNRKRVSLNEEIRRQEKEEGEARQKKRKEELLSRQPLQETIYEISVKQAAEAELPEPSTKDGVKLVKDETSASTPPAHPIGVAAEDESESEPESEKLPDSDPTLKEAKRILHDLILLSSEEKALAQAPSGSSP